MVSQEQEVQGILVEAAVAERGSGRTDYTPAFNLLYFMYGTTLAYDVLTRYYDTPDKLTQGSNAVWARVFNKLGTYDRKKSDLYTWLVTLATNACRDDMLLVSAEDLTNS
jgi:hypothetical protein